MKVKIVSLSGIESLRKTTPSGNQYLFFVNKYTDVTDKEDLEYFKQKDNFEVKGTVEVKTKEVAKIITEKVEDVYAKVVNDTSKDTQKADKAILLKKLIKLSAIGEEIADLLFKEYGTLEKIKLASLSELEALPLIGKRRAKIIHSELKNI